MKRTPTHQKDPGFPNQVREWLQSLKDKQFAAFFYDAVSERVTSDMPEWRGHFLLAHCEHVDDGPWAFDFIALDDLQKYPEGWVDDVPICQSGRCSGCGSAVRSWAKDAICPVCGGKVRCT